MLNCIESLATVRTTICISDIDQNVVTLKTTAYVKGKNNAGLYIWNINLLNVKLPFSRYIRELESFSQAGFLSAPAFCNSLASLKSLE